MIRSGIFIFMGILVVVLLNLKPIMAEISLSTPYIASDEEHDWVDGFRSDIDVLVPDGEYRFVRTYSNGEMMDATFLIDSDTNSVTITGTITTGDFVKDIFGTAQYVIDGAVIDYHDVQGHVQLFPDTGHVLAMLPDNRLMIRSQHISLTSL